MYIDWSKAPEGATHWCTRDKMFKTLTVAQLQCCIPRPTKPAAPEWDGKGNFPEVHTDCLMYDDKKTLVKVRIISWIDGYTVGWCADREQVYFSKDPKDFRPLRTQADRHRDELAEIIHTEAENSFPAPTRWDDIADAIIAAGYRKEKE